jgi:hypothetical protein
LRSSNNFHICRGYDFISIQIDGKTEADFYCSFEGLYYYAFHLAEIMWGVLWLYDLQLMTRRPGLFTGKYLMYYACIAYFSSFGFSIVLYFQNVDNFTSVSTIFELEPLSILLKRENTNRGRFLFSS